jgi:hypothetical protein
MDNNRELFTNKGAFDLDPEYLHYSEEVSNVYTNEASHKAFGVWDEVQLGGYAFLSILDNIDEQVALLHCLIGALTEQINNHRSKKP